MRRISREINTLSISALDLFATAMGAFAIIMLILFPHYRPAASPSQLPQQGKPFTNSIGMKFVPVAAEAPDSAAAAAAKSSAP